MTILVSEMSDHTDSAIFLGNNDNKERCCPVPFTDCFDDIYLFQGSKLCLCCFALDLNDDKMFDMLGNCSHYEIEAGKEHTAI